MEIKESYPIPPANKGSKRVFYCVQKFNSQNEWRNRFWELHYFSCCKEITRSRADRKIKGLTFQINLYDRLWIKKIAAVDIKLRSPFSSHIWNMCIKRLYKGSVSQSFRDNFFFFKNTTTGQYNYLQLFFQGLPLLLIFQTVGQK